MGCSRKYQRRNVACRPSRARPVCKVMVLIVSSKKKTFTSKTTACLSYHTHNRSIMISHDSRYYLIIVPQEDCSGVGPPLPLMPAHSSDVRTAVPPPALLLFSRVLFDRAVISTGEGSTTPPPIVRNAPPAAASISCLTRRVYSLRST